MSSTMLALMLMQYVVSVKAGLVNHVQGSANVVEMEQVRQGHSIETAANGYVEVLLTPGSFLRLGGNSAVVLDDVDLESVSLRVVKGPALIEVVDINKKFPIHVTTGMLTTNLVAPGIYKFENGVASVLDGKLEIAGSKLAYEKGWNVFFQDNYRARKVKQVSATSLDVYSQARSETISRANASVASSLAPSYRSLDPYWLFSPNLGFYVFMPFDNCRSPYGYPYYTPGIRRSLPQTTYTPSNNSGGGTVAPPPPSTSNNSNNSGGGGGAAPVVSTPSGEQTAPAVYIESKSSTVGATQ